MDSRPERPRSTQPMDGEMINFKEIMREIDPEMILPESSNNLLNLIANELTYQIITQSGAKAKLREDDKIRKTDVEEILSAFQLNANPNITPEGLEQYKPQNLQEVPTNEYLIQRDAIKKYIQERNENN